MESKYKKNIEEIKAFLKENPGISQCKAAEALGIPETSFRFIIKKEGLSYFFEPSKVVLELLAQACEENKGELFSSYQRFLTLVKKNNESFFISQLRFQTLAKKSGYNLTSKVRRKFRSNDFKEIFKEHSENLPGKAVQRSFELLFLQNFSRTDFLHFDNNLSEEHLKRYLYVKKSKCWCCGKTNHFGTTACFELDHISGNNRDHRLSNLRWLCACCHRTTTTYARTLKQRKKSAETGLYANFLGGLDVKELENHYKKTEL